jgi:putative endonuclease
MQKVRELLKRLGWGGARPLLSPASERGRQGERAAERHLKKNGYKILVRNYRSRWGEIDLVCRHDGNLVFVEVKARKPDSLLAPIQAVNSSKRRRLARTAQAYVNELSVSPPARFDVVEVSLDPSGPRCHIIRQAFNLASL